MNKTAPGLIALLLVSSASSLARASGTGPAGDFEYPELMVTPHASERLEQESRHEASRRWTTHLPLQVSALATLVAGAAQLGNPDLGKDPDKISGVVGVAVGGGWLLTSLLLASTYEPYESGWQDVGPMPAKSQREQLARERASEEVLHRAARSGSRLRWLSLATNVATSAYLLGQSKPKTFSKVMDAGALVAAFAPIIFPYHWQDVWAEHQGYKKHIYGPIAQFSAAQDPVNRKLAPALSLSVSF